RSTKEADASLDESLEIATLMEAPVILINNPISVRPTAANRTRLARLVARIPHDVTKLAWEPPGLWEEEETQAMAADLGLVLVGDAARDPLAPGQVAYTRLRDLGEFRRLSMARMDKVLAHLQPFREAFVVIETEGPGGVAKAIRAAAEQGGVVRPPRVRHIEYPIRAEDEEQ
ncbi:MAG: hypothetical protein CSA75_04885, partial [Sorangium cellulosum]